ncbi:MAG: cytochrome c biogenesis protein CcdA [Myxococcota bacterium]
MMQRMLGAMMALGVLVLTSAWPTYALAASLPLAGITAAASPDGECTEPAAAEGAAADVMIKARLLAALCRDNGIAAGALSFVAGLLTSLSPCVYPLIPITISIFGARQASSRLKAFSLSALYVLGMSVLYTGLGVTFASLGLVSGSLMAMPAVVGAIGLLCLVMAASMFGAFEITLPSSLQNRLAQAGGSGYRGAFVMGLAAGVIAAPCTGPVLAVILGLISKSQKPGLGVALMASYSLGMGVLFLVLGTFSSALSRVPKSGRWMETVKSILGLSMIAVALYLVKPHVPLLQHAADALAALPSPALVGLILLVVGVGVGALHLSFHDDTAAKVRKGFGVTLASVGLFSLVSWVEAVPATASAGGEIAWLTSHDAAVEAGRRDGKPVMMDFGADWCAACKELEKITYRDPTVIAEASRFVNAKIDSTEMTDQMTALWQKYGITGLPAVIFIDSTGKVLTDPRVEGFLAAPDYLREMKKVR